MAFDTHYAQKATAYSGRLSDYPSTACEVSPCAPDRSPLAEAIDRNASATGYLHSLIDALHDKLAPAMRPQNPNGCGTARPDADSDLIRAIETGTDTVSSANARIRDILDRLVL